ncbi:hypothetical protein ES332_A03G028800v1 [Gossypium tomentosum]|uniref:Knottin scorpion toxin-like domain-containing protein n=1 Tax=Gossypium tomentosum TaxID=34277 RepID=A0A5D2R2P7_GOSTO|nr:hypothetical protein ES332_A03G028800v1 [Gossypium tomentosum]
MEASLKLVVFFTLLLSSGMLFSDVPTMVEAQQKKLKCKTDEDCVRQCATDLHVCTPAGYCACAGSNPECC